ncbi:unnamed protein product [Protopolystoma xenopodis]|uniref:Uncharacterized protein n=1 Tax=Protopolystoma xenopodis TaxID=117903 RepID=A0A3S4ZJ49_9PLAT|nr:unnamed protein product [Protopolystoma xenopodis]
MADLEGHRTFEHIIEQICRQEVLIPGLEGRVNCSMSQ